MGAPPYLPIVPRSQTRPNIGAPRQRSPSIVSLTQVPRRRSPPPYPQVGSEQVQEEVIERQQQRTRVTAPQATPDWTLDEETWLTELMREGIHIEDAAEALDRTVGDVIHRWAQIEDENRETESRGRERQRAREKFQIRHRPTNPPVTNKAPPATHAPVLDRTVESVTQRLADMEVENREAERRGRERQRAREKSHSRHRPANPPVEKRASPAAPAATLHGTVENVENGEAERGDRERRQGTGKESHTASLNRTILCNVRERLADIEDEDWDAEKRARERRRVRGELWADIEGQNREDERRRGELQRAREHLLAIIEDENREAEWRGRERQGAREELQNRCRPTNAAVRNGAAPTTPAVLPDIAVEKVAQGSAVVEDVAQGSTIVEDAAQGSATVEDEAQGSANVEDERIEDTNRTVRMRQRARHEFQNLYQPTNRLRTNQAPLPTPVAQQQRGRSVRPSSRKPAAYNAIAVDAAPEPGPATVRPQRERPSGASYRYREWNGRRRGFTTGNNTSIRLRSTNRYRSHSPRERGTSNF